MCMCMHVFVCVLLETLLLITTGSTPLSPSKRAKVSRLEMRHPISQNRDTDSTDTLKDQVSEFSALQMRYNKEQMPALPNCKEVSPLSHLSVPLLQNALGQRYKKQLVCCMRGRKERREVYSEINLKSTQRFGAICSPFQALHLTVSGLVELHVCCGPSVRREGIDRDGNV